MRMYLFMCLLAYVLAEPPVGDGYPAARSSHSHGIDHQSHLSQEYGLPEIGARSQKNHATASARSQSYSSYTPSSRVLSQEYGSPARSSLSQEYGSPARSSLSQEYGTPNLRSEVSEQYGAPHLRTGVSQEYGVPNSRSLSQQYGVPVSRNTISTEYGTPSALPQEYNAPNTRVSQAYGAPQLKSNVQDYNTIGDFPSDSYSAPPQTFPSSLYESPEFQSNPSEEYGVPSQRSFGQAPSKKYGQPTLRNIQGFSSSSHSNSYHSGRQSKHSTASRNFHTTFGARTTPQGFGNSRSLSSQYGAPSARNTDSYSPSTKSISQSYLPSSKTVSQSYGVPNERSLSSEYGAPESRTHLKTNAVASQFDSARSISSHKNYVARDSMPSDNYGVPDQYNAISNQGYSYARNALDELLNQEPANYDFGYKVSDFESGSDFGHTESRQENRAEGSYFVVLPDGTKQIVEYEADERGFKPRISVEPAEARGGYDENASNLGRSGDGPY